MNSDWGFIAWGLVFGILCMGYMMVLACWPRHEHPPTSEATDQADRRHKEKTAV